MMFPNPSHWRQAFRAGAKETLLNTAGSKDKRML